MPTTTASKRFPRTYLAHSRLRPKPSAKAAYRSILAAVASVELGLGLRTRGLAAALTVAKFLWHRLEQHKASRNVASVLLNRVNCLRNVPQPWPVEAVAEALRATQAMQRDPELEVMHEEVDGFVFPLTGRRCEKTPLDLALDELVADLGSPRGMSRDKLVAAADWLALEASRLFAPSACIQFIIPGVQRTDVNARRDARRNEVVRWLSWQVAEYLAAVRSTRRVGAQASAIVLECLPELADPDEPPDLNVMRCRAKKDYFPAWSKRVGGMTGLWTAPDPSEKPDERARTFQALPLAQREFRAAGESGIPPEWHLNHYALLADAFEALPD